MTEEAAGDFRQATRVTPEAPPEPNFQQAVSLGERRGWRRRFGVLGTAVALMAAMAVGGGSPSTATRTEPSPTATSEQGQNPWIKSARKRLDGQEQLRPGERIVNNVVITHLPNNEVKLDENGQVREDIDALDYPSENYLANGMPDVVPVAKIRIGTKIGRVLAVQGGVTPSSEGQPTTFYVARAVDAKATDMNGKPITNSEVTITFPAINAQTQSAQPLAP